MHDTSARIIRDFSFSAVVAGLLTVIVSYAGSSVIIFQAADAAGLARETTSSWIWAVSIGSGLTGIMLSWRMKTPIITAWSTPGAALLVAALPTVSYGEAVAAYIVSALIIIAVGISGALDKLVSLMPKGVCAGLFAGILFNFGTGIFTAMGREPLIAIGMFAIFLLAKKIYPRYAVPLVMLGGIAICAACGAIHMQTLDFAPAVPVFTMPQWSARAVLSLGLPLALVTLTGQYISGMAVLHASGYRVPANGIMSVTGLFSLVLAPFGSHAVNLSSITAAICTGEDAHPDSARRYTAGLASGAFYLVVGTFGSSLITLFAALPSVFISTLAGLALLGAFASGISGVVNDSQNLEAGTVTFLATASGVTFLGLGPAFWGLVAGGLSTVILRARKK